MATVKDLKAAIAAIPEEHDSDTVYLDGCDCSETWCGHIHFSHDHPGPFSSAFELHRSDHCADAPEEEPDYS